MSPLPSGVFLTSEEVDACERATAAGYTEDQMREFVRWLVDIRQTPMRSCREVKEAA